MVALGHEYRASSLLRRSEWRCLEGGRAAWVAVSLRSRREKQGLRCALGNALDLTGWCGLFVLHIRLARQTFLFLASFSVDVVRVLELSRCRCSSSFQLCSPEAHVLLWSRHSAFGMRVRGIRVIILSVSCRRNHFM